ncbi:hypothetical protein LOTGIDRAFT_233408 [Lottia gigantea]|uniref:ADF-H domain-containing protein n=1 Tax=Lottia gigantea TaxID=225164 RepID=V4A980_LOTGI|nr:hypothetical protein LOTGIDRAFT_233408 [Lottia gigantea]ESO91630.1 hypothetical protein LOTGIDRAFT_233408 [Lottia gigantea]
MSSGIEFPKELETQFEKLKMGKAHRYLSIIISSKSVEGSNKTTEVFEVEKMPAKNCPNEDPEGCLQELMELLQDNQCRFVVFLMSAPNIAGILKENIFFVQYVPDCASIKKKMLYTASADVLKQRFEGVTIIQLNDLSDCKSELFLSKIRM